ncbi:hypothetical protein OG455_30520 [Kitasatospora sp. NBC_01287]|uniref:CYTH domain-containing protein n=1 Tax=Kitasatospora sp. NBC_01287 TaxID=2903573 RepID=UPI00225230A7|nr:CYTH domain-containing protein [Kitasatospora sp. NBC_01287]MCX4749799.1 hypothetical protein [Kitasatospora sp. NBC_01287]
MAVEAELKAIVRDPEAVTERLEEAYAPGRPEVYQDTYYDTPAGLLDQGDRELRIRTVQTANGRRGRSHHRALHRRRRGLPLTPDMRQRSFPARRIAVTVGKLRGRGRTMWHLEATRAEA